MNPNHIALLGTIRADLALTGESLYRQQALLKMMLDLSFGGATEQDVRNAEFIVKARLVHGQKYDYSRVEYHRAIEKVVILCPEHGAFLQTPNSHLKPAGCPHCAGNAKSSAGAFIARAKELHGDKFGYDKVVYRNMHTPVIVLCAEHGEFQQTPAQHLSGSGCPRCAGRNQTTETFIAAALAVHGGRYGYDRVEYRRKNQKVVIECPPARRIPTDPCQTSQRQRVPKMRWKEPDHRDLHQARSGCSWSEVRLQQSRVRAGDDEGCHRVP